MKIASVTISANTSAIISDALASVIDQVDVAVLVDTGISDDTVDKARVVAGQKLRVCKYAWKNDFSAARNASLDFARELEAEWAVVVDTDERFAWNGTDLRSVCEKSTVDAIDVASLDGFYSKEKIFRLSSEAGVRYYGPTHEAPIYRSKETLASATFDELPKSAAQLASKRKRDLEVLLSWVSNPENAKDGRWWYYLGDTFHALGNLDAAANAFAKCVELRPAVSEEGAYAAYRQAECLSQAGKLQEAIVACAVGLSRHAGVAELAWLAAFVCHRLNQPEQAVSWANIAIAIGRYVGCAPRRQGFVHLPALYELPYDVLRFALPTPEERSKAEISFQRAKCARWGVKDARLGVDGKDIETICVTKCSQRSELRATLRPPSIQRLCGGTRIVTLTVNYKRIEAAGYGKYRAMNPSVCLHKGELWAIVRMVNYTIENGSYVSSDEDGIVRTINLIGRMVMQDFGWTLDEFSIVTDKDDGLRQPTTVLGYEDMRLFSVDGKLWASATVRDRDRDRCQIALLELDDVGDVVKATIQDSDRWIEKNWMPIVGDEIKWLYELDPTTVRRKDGTTSIQKCSLALEHLRGGSQVIPFDDGFLCVTHETIEQNGWGCRRIYLHRFVRFDKELRVTSVSPTWIFEDGSPHGIEFCAGLARDPQKPERLIISYGVEDRQAKLLVVSEDEVRNMQWIMT
jgi:tetratricopeptide (TPR) repeat protein